MGRFGFAILLPLAVFPLVAAAAIFVGWTLHQFSYELGGGLKLSVIVALLLTLAITAAGFIADRNASR